MELNQENNNGNNTEQNTNTEQNIGQKQSIHSDMVSSIGAAPLDIFGSGIVASHQGTRPDDPSHHPFSPIPDLVTGELLLDPEIELRAKAFSLAISFYYSTASTAETEYGFARSASPRGYIFSSTSTSIVTIVRGDLKAFPFVIAGTSGGALCVNIG